MDPEDVRIWFGVISLIVVEVGPITPPVGLNVVSNSMARDVPMTEYCPSLLPTPCAWR